MSRKGKAKIIVSKRRRHSASKVFTNYDEAFDHWIKELIGSCSCLTKTPNYLSHSVSCPYRVKIEEVLDEQGEEPSS